MNKNKKALLIIDMQKGSFTDETPRFDSEGVVERINRLSKLFRELSFPVIFIQHDGSRDQMFIPETPDWEILSELEIESGDLIVQKYAHDAFYETDLHKTIQEYQINDLLITGCATDFCVEASIQSALSKDYNITVVQDGHTTGNRPHLTAERVIEHHNWVWQNMIPTLGKIEVVPFKTVYHQILNQNKVSL